jgi:hypothetical protein
LRKKEEILSNPSSLIENDALQRQQEEKKNKGKIEIALQSPSAEAPTLAPVASKTNHLGIGLYNS